MAWDVSLMLGLISITFFFFYQAIKFDQNEKDVHKWIKILMYFLGWGGVVMIVGFSRLIVEKLEPTASSVLHMIDILWFVLLSILFGVIVYWLLFFAWNFYKSKLEIKKAVLNRRVLNPESNYGGRHD
jgi:hypothetical protein